MKIALDSEITFFRSEKKRQNCMGVGKCLCGCEIMGRMKSNTLIPEGHSFLKKKVEVKVIWVGQSA